MPDTNANTVKSFKQRKSFGETACVVYLSATISRSTSPTSFVRYRARIFTHLRKPIHFMRTSVHCGVISCVYFMELCILGLV